MIYLAVPYSFNPKVSYDKVNNYAGALIKEGHFVYSPISMCHPIARCVDLPTGFEYWEAFDYKMIDVCDCMVVLCLKGWQQSKGVIKEIRYAQSKGIPIYYRYENQIPSQIEVVDHAV